MRAPVSAIGDHLVRFFSRHVSILLYYRDLKLGNSVYNSQFMFSIFTGLKRAGAAYAASCSWVWLVRLLM